MSPTKRSAVEVNSYLFYGRDSPLISQFDVNSVNKVNRKSSVHREPLDQNKSLIASIRANSPLNRSTRTVSKHREQGDKSFRISTSIQPGKSPSKQSRPQDGLKDYKIDYKILLPNKSKLSSSQQRNRPTLSPINETKTNSKPWEKTDGLDQLVYRRPESTLEQVKTIQAKRRNVEATVRRALVREVKQTRDRQLLYRSKMQRIIRMNHLADYNDESHVNGMSLLPRF